MENIKKIADELRAQIQDEWTMGCPSTSRETYKELQPCSPKSLAKNYVTTYADHICNQNTLFWRTINTKIATLLGYYNEANDYLKRESYRVPTRHVAQCLRHTSLSYIMNLIYYGLLQNSITPKNIQQVQRIPPDEKGLGLQIAGIDVEEYNEQLKSIAPTLHTPATNKDTKNNSILNNPQAKALLDELVKAEILLSDYSLGTTTYIIAAVIAEAVCRYCKIQKKNVLFAKLWNIKAKQIQDGLTNAKRASDKTEIENVLYSMFKKKDISGNIVTDFEQAEAIMKVFK